MTTGTDTGKTGAALMTEREAKPSLLGRIGGLFRGTPSGELITPAEEPEVLRTTARIAWSGQPFRLALGNVVLEVHPDVPMSGDEKDGNREWIVHPGRAFYDGGPTFTRIKPGDSVLLGRIDDVQRDIFGFDKSVADRHVRISNRKGELTIQPLEVDRPTRVSAIASPTAVWETRRANLMRLPGVLGHPLIPFDDDEALGMLQDVNAILAAEAYRELDEEGAPGGVIQFPNDMLRRAPVPTTARPP